MRCSNEPDVEQVLQDAQQNLESDTLKQMRSVARACLRREIEQTKYRVS